MSDNLVKQWDEYIESVGSTALGHGGVGGAHYTWFLLKWS
jgi:hypothetical protein